MVNLILSLVVVGLGLLVVLTVGAVWFQGYIYTEPSEGLLWHAPAGAGLLTLFIALWCYLNATSPGASPTDIPYNVIHSFSSRVEMFKEPAPRLWSIKKGNPDPIEYKLRKDPQAGQVRTEYVENLSGSRPWSPTGVEAVLLEHKGEKIRFEPRKAAEGGYREFVSPQGWVMIEFETGLNGIPTMSRTDRVFVNLLLNGLHLVLWFAVLWLLVRFQWSHAFGLALVFWAVTTVLVLPMLLREAAAIAPPATIGV